MHQNCIKCASESHQFFRKPSENHSEIQLHFTEPSKECSGKGMSSPSAMHYCAWKVHHQLQPPWASSYTHSYIQKGSQVHSVSGGLKWTAVVGLKWSQCAPAGTVSPSKSSVVFQRRGRRLCSAWALPGSLVLQAPNTGRSQRRLPSKSGAVSVCETSAVPKSPSYALRT